MTPEENVLVALRALAESDRGREAPPELGERLLTAFRQRQRGRRWRIRAAWAMAAAAVLIAMVVGARQVRHSDPARVVMTTPILTPAPAAAVEPVDAPKAARVRPAPEREIMTEFFPLLEITDSLDRGELVRVSLPASAMRTVGLPVREDRLSERVQADVLVSEEGLATAIRFVKYSGDKE